MGSTLDEVRPVYLADQLGAFGEVLSTHLEPRVQIDAVYGARSTDVEAITATGGAATASAGMFVCQSGTTVGGYGVVRSRRTVRYRPGQGVRYRFTALFTTGVPLSIQLAGALTATDALCVGYSGSSFGFLRRIAGASAIHRLTMTQGAGGAETITVTLNGAATTVVAAGALSAAATAELIAERVGGYTGWTSVVSPTSNGSTVTFMQANPAATSGAFTLSSTGAAAGTFATVQAGATNDDATGFVAQSEWNLDTCDGSGSYRNASRFMLDPAKLNVFEIVYGYLGAAPILLRVMSSAGRWINCHRVLYSGAYTVPSQRNPTFRLGWVAASLGSTTALTVRGASAAGFIEGPYANEREPFAVLAQLTATTTEYVALAVRVRGDFGSTVNQRVILAHTLRTALETSNRVVALRCYLNPTLTGSVTWGYASESSSCVEYASPATVTVSGGQLTAATSCASGSPDELELHEIDLRLEPGDVFAVTVQTGSSTALTNLSLNWQEI